MKLKEFEPEASINKGQFEYIEMHPSKNGGYLKTADVIKWLNEHGNRISATGKYFARILQEEIST